MRPRLATPRPLRSALVCALAVCAATGLPDGSREAIAARSALDEPAPPASPASPPAVLRPAPLLIDAPPRERSFRLVDSLSNRDADLLFGFRDASLERLGPMRAYTSGPWGRWLERPWLPLRWAPREPALADAPSLDAAASPDAPELTFALGPEALTAPPVAVFADRAWVRAVEAALAPSLDTTGPSLASDGLGALWNLPPLVPVVDWRCRRRPVVVTRPEGEAQRFDLVRCDGSTAPDALDRLSVLARPPEAPSPGDLLPDAPDPAAWEAAREWAPGVRVLHPRLAWVVQKLADAFPYKPIVIYSGYRPLAEVNDGTGHKSLHASGRALDVAVQRVPNEEVFRVCRELKDVGCGYYPNGRFVHVDVRKAHGGKAFWIDASEPGQPARYVDSWPGVVDRGAAPFLQAAP